MDKRYVWSDSLEKMVILRKEVKGKIYEWDDEDCVYYSVESDEDYFM